MLALLVTGPPGAGKSEVASALHDSLGDGGEDAAMIEVDALERSYPPIDRDRAVSHLAMLAGSYRELGTPILLVTATLEDDGYRDAAVAAIGARETLVVRLEADPETLRERILAREPPGWGGLPDLLNASRRLAAEMKDLGGVDLVISTEGRQPAEVAAELERALRERLTG
jgi:predicted kinase